MADPGLRPPSDGHMGVAVGLPLHVGTYLPVYLQLKWLLTTEEPGLCLFGFESQCSWLTRQALVPWCAAVQSLGA